MRVAALQQFLRSLPPALEAAGSHQAAAQINEAVRGLEPFQALAVADFAAFLVRAKEFHDSGAVRVPVASERQAEKLLTLVARLSDAAKNSSQVDLAGAQQEVAVALQTLAAEAGLKGKLLPDPKWADAKAARAQVEPHLLTIYDLAARIIAPEVYSDPPIREAIARLESALDGDALKAVAAEFGIRATAKSKPAKVIGDILAKLTGHKPAKTRTKTKTSSVDPAVVEEHARRLSALIERSADPDAVPEGEVEAELARLKGLGKPTLFEVANRAGIEGVRSAESVSAILQRIRIRLTAARRARERAEV